MGFSVEWGGGGSGMFVLGFLGVVLFGGGIEMNGVKKKERVVGKEWGVKGDG